MCIGTPMQVRERLPGGLYAECTPWVADAESPKSSFVCETVDVQLVAEVRPGDWLLVFLGAAREILTPERAQSVGRALLALQQFQPKSLASGSSGDPSDALDARLFDDLFPDLNREPELPAHLQQAFLAQQKTPDQTGRLDGAAASEADQPKGAQPSKSHYPKQGLQPSPEEPGE